MAKYLDITDEERAEARRRIENFFAFTRDVLDDPSILEKIPKGAHVVAIPIDEGNPGTRYDVVTPNTVAIVTPPPAPRTRREAPKRSFTGELVRPRRSMRTPSARRQRDARRFRLTHDDRRTA